MSGTLLTKRDTFLTRGEYMQLLYASCGPTRSGLRDLADIRAAPPAIMRPHMLWTGKQVGFYRLLQLEVALYIATCQQHGRQLSGRCHSLCGCLRISYITGHCQSACSSAVTSPSIAC